jgi:hypothetical protein
MAQEFEKTDEIPKPKYRRDKPLKTPQNQAQRVIQKFGGAIRLSAILGTLGHKITVSAIRKWGYPKAKGGTNGFVPPDHWALIFKAARKDGILFTSKDLDPRIDAAMEPHTVAWEEDWRRQAMPIHKHGVTLPDDKTNFRGRPRR